MKHKHLFSESAVWVTESEFTDANGNISKGNGESHITVSEDKILNKSWAKTGNITISNNYEMTKVSDNQIDYCSLNPDLGSQSGTFYVTGNNVFSKFTVYNTELNGFEIIRQEGDTCFATGALYNGDELVNTWTAVMKKEKEKES